MSEHNDGKSRSQKDHGGSYMRFTAMIATSMVVMFFLMYLHSYQLIDHAWFSETRLFMTLIMGGGMVIVMLLYMLHMYTSTSRNLIAIAVGIALIAAGIGLVRSQVTVSDTDYGRDDPSPLDRDTDERAGSHRGSAGAEARGRDHRGAAT